MPVLRLKAQYLSCGSFDRQTNGLMFAGGKLCSAPMAKGPPIHYASYLKLDRLLSLQEPESARHGRPAHDETLFIIVHQVYELWFKQFLHEIDSVRSLFRQDRVAERDMGLAASRLHRVAEIAKLLIDQLSILETMTPLDFLDFRDLLSPASGFQSIQFHDLEMKFGVQLDPAQMEHRQRNLGSTRADSAADVNPSLFTLVERWLERTPFLDFRGFNFWSAYRSAVTAMLERDEKAIATHPSLSDSDKEQEKRELAKTRESFDALLDKERHDDLVKKKHRRLSHKATQAALLIHLYRDQPAFHVPFRLLTTLVDIDELLASWRHRHALMAFRMIGTKIGTGGTSGYGYLRSTVESRKVFTDLANLATFLIPRSALPSLPEHVEKSLGFAFEGSA